MRVGAALLECSVQRTSVQPLVVVRSVRLCAVVCAVPGVAGKHNFKFRTPFGHGVASDRVPELWLNVGCVGVSLVGSIKGVIKVNTYTHTHMHSSVFVF